MKRLLHFGITIIIFTNCQSSEDKLHNDIKGLDGYIRNHSIDPEGVLNKLEVIASYLSKSTKRELIEKNWVTNIDYKWNSDSSITLIKSIKNIEKSTKREVIVNLNDTALIILRHHVWFDETRRNKNGHSPGYIFHDEIAFLTREKIIKLFRKMDFDNTDLSDTVQFKQAPFIDLSADASQNWYNSEIEYTRKILNHN